MATQLLPAHCVDCLTAVLKRAQWPTTLQLSSLELRMAMDSQATMEFLESFRHLTPALQTQVNVGKVEDIAPPPKRSRGHDKQRQPATPMGNGKGKGKGKSQKQKPLLQDDDSTKPLLKALAHLTLRVEQQVRQQMTQTCMVIAMQTDKDGLLYPTWWTWPINGRTKR